MSVICYCVDFQLACAVISTIDVKNVDPKNKKRVFYEKIKTVKNVE